MTNAPKHVTKTDLQNLTVVKLAEMYNVFATKLGVNSLKKFRDKKTGIERVLKIQAECIVKFPPKASKKSVKSKRKTIKQTSIEYILEDKNDQEIIELIQSEFPTSAFDQGHISWLRCTLYRDGIIEAKHAPRRSKAYKNWLKDNS